MILKSHNYDMSRTAQDLLCFGAILWQRRLHRSTILLLKPLKMIHFKM